MSDFFINETKALCLPDKRKNLSIGELFSNVEYSALEIENDIVHFERCQPPILTQNNYMPEKRFSIADPDLEEFVRKSFVCLFIILRKMQYMDQYKMLLKDDRDKYIKWIEQLFGKGRKTNEFFLSIRIRKGDLIGYDKDKRMELKKSVRKVIQQDDADIKCFQEELKGNKFQYVRDRYRIVNSLLSLIFPDFLN